jgi:hypothetical protein
LKKPHVPPKLSDTIAAGRAHKSPALFRVASRSVEETS